MAKRRRFLIFSAVAAVVLVAVGLWSGKGCCSGRVTCGVEECNITEPIDSLFRSIFPDPKEPGCVVAVMYRDTIIYCNAFGLADISTGTPMTDTTLVNIASATKSFTTGAMLLLDEKGIISLDSTVSHYYPEFKAGFFSKVTLRDILAHTSGLPDLRPRNREEWASYLTDHTSVFARNVDYRLYGDDCEHIHIFEKMTAAEYEPRTSFTVNESGYTLLSALIPRLTGKEYAAWMNENIFGPAGVRSAFYITPGVTYPRCAHGYRPAEVGTEPLSFRSKDGKWDEYDYGEAPFFISKGDRGAYCTIHDFLNWKRAFFDGAVISNESLMQMLEPLTDTDLPKVKYGLGCSLTLTPGQSIREYHCNSNGGFCDVESSWPACRLHYAVFANRSDMPLSDVFIAMDSILYANGYIR